MREELHPSIDTGSPRKFRDLGSCRIHDLWICGRSARSARGHRSPYQIHVGSAERIQSRSAKRIQSEVGRKPDEHRTVA